MCTTVYFHWNIRFRTRCLRLPIMHTYMQVYVCVCVCVVDGTHLVGNCRLDLLLVHHLCLFVFYLFLFIFFFNFKFHSSIFILFQLPPITHLKQPPSPSLSARFAMKGVVVVVVVVVVDYLFGTGTTPTHAFVLHQQVGSLFSTLPPSSVLDPLLSSAFTTSLVSSWPPAPSPISTFFIVDKSWFHWFIKV